MIYFNLINCKYLFISTRYIENFMHFDIMNKKITILIDKNNINIYN